MVSFHFRGQKTSGQGQTDTVWDTVPKNPHISFTVHYRKHQIFQLRKCTNLRKILAQFKFNVNPTSQKSQDRRTKHWKGKWY